MSRTSIFLWIPLLLACSQTRPSSDYYEQARQEISNIQSDEDLRHYLNQILNEDQIPRNSQEHKHLMLENDLLNTTRIDLLLSMKGYPRLTQVGDSLIDVPILVIHHTPGNNLEIREKHFSLFHSQYIEGTINENLLELFMDRMHVIKHGSFFHMKSPYRFEEKIDTLIQILELEP